MVSLHLLNLHIEDRKSNVPQQGRGYIACHTPKGQYKSISAQRYWRYFESRVQEAGQLPHPFIQEEKTNVHNKHACWDKALQTDKGAQIRWTWFTRAPSSSSKSSHISLSSSAHR